MKKLAMVMLLVMMLAVLGSGLAVTNATPTNAPGQGPIAAAGDLMVVAEDPNVIGVFLINSDGSLTQLSTTVDNRAQAPFSLSMFPNTR
jgi:F0F1-type ATP synthase membrane subunit c/vacuolar-type H+-ATPase subunit K